MDSRPIKQHFLEDGNGIMCCYNMFPTQFGKISSMTAYLPIVRAMGFNAVWVNPLQETTGIVMEKRDKKLGVRAGNTVTGSLYAMRNTNTISTYFSEAPRSITGELLVTEAEAEAMDTQALQRFTQTACANGLVPIFDLVLNHLAADAPLCNEKPHWFAKSVHPDFQDARAFNYEDDAIRQEIIEQFWKPYIRKYMEQYGFHGARVDAVGYIHPDVRREIYAYIHELEGIGQPVILDEALFSGDTHKMSASLRLPSAAAASHITTGVYYAQREWHGGLPSWSQIEAKAKGSVIFQTQEGEVREQAKGGCINFSGNHDHNSLAATIILEMANERLYQNQRLHQLAGHLNQKYGPDEGRECIFLHSFASDIEQSIASQDQAIIHEVERRMREKIAMCALTSSGGWYALAGDETGGLTPKSVFRRQQALEQDYYPQRTHSVFLGENKNLAESALIEIARSIIEEHPLEVKAHMDEAYRALSHSQEQERILTAYVENLKNLVNCGDPIVCTQLQKTLEGSHLEISFNDWDYIAASREASKGWGGHHSMRDFMKEVNTLLQQLPTSQYGFSSEMIRLPEKPELVIVVRKNGSGFNAETDLVIVNLTPAKPTTLELKDLEDIAVIYQKRVFPKGFNIDDPDVAAAFFYTAKKSEIHLGSTILPSQELIDSKRVKQVAIAPIYAYSSTEPSQAGIFSNVTEAEKRDNQSTTVPSARPDKP
ncbi:MAG: hypothetical protein A3J38_09945 [Gammaproteobacteria bacterium RIFCSPHIGHO2_12_FULL_45_9]|nr:MAG: hypothetical protein A3J38_09945 [Gammaproteobacteria bacterium RIFCSPHIGHO2_12_FULL_45_9]